MKQNHTWHECDCHQPGCMFCDGALGLCTVCDGFEGTLTTHCCNRQLSQEEKDEIYKGNRDFVNGGWVYRPKPDPRWNWDGETAASTAWTKPLPDLPEGMFYDKKTQKPSVECSQCGKPFEWPLDVSEYDPNVPENHYCGGSPRCCP